MYSIIYNEKTGRAITKEAKQSAMAVIQGKERRAEVEMTLQGDVWLVLKNEDGNVLFQQYINHEDIPNIDY